MDVEEYFQVAALADHIDRSEWDRLESRVSRPLHRILELLEKEGARGTFFVLGWLAERNPQLVRDIAAAGHEVASHGWGHEVVQDQDAERFRSSVRDSKALLEDITGEPVLGFRAPCFSIVPGYEWTFDVLIEEGYRYDSSLLPVRRPGFSYPAAVKQMHWIERPAGRILEVPPSTVRVFGLDLLGAGGAYFRIFPYEVVRRALRQAEERGQPATFYIHPWELDPGQPRLRVPLTTRLRHYTGLADTSRRLELLLREFRFDSIASSLNGSLSASAGVSLNGGGRLEPVTRRRAPGRAASAGAAEG